MQGTYTALVTPFSSEGIDIQSLRNNIAYQIAQGVEGLLILGSTGEGALVTDCERLKIIETTKKEVKDLVPFWVNCGGLSTSHLIDKVREAENCGANGVLIAPPYYVLPNQEGLYEYFKSISFSTKLPIMLYNHPKRTGVSIDLSTLKRLAQLPNIIGMKDASKDIDYIGEIIFSIPDFIIMSGDDMCTLPYLSLGAKGVFSVLSNIIPNKISNFVRKPSIEEHYKLFPLYQFAQCDTNPIPVKAMMQKMGMINEKCRSPLTILNQEHQKKMEDLLLTYA